MSDDCHPAEIVIATPADWERVRRLRLAALLEAPDSFGAVYADEAAKPPEWWIGRLESSGSVTLLALAPEDAGIAVLGPASGNERGLYAVWVAPACRGRGVGDALVATALQLARTEGMHRIHLSVGRHNEASRRLYLRHGFAFTGAAAALPPPRAHLLEEMMERFFKD